MERRDVVKRALEGSDVPYTPWSFRFTKEATDKLDAHYGSDELTEKVGNHFIELGSDYGHFDELGGNRFRDVFGVIWDRTVEKDIGFVEGRVLPNPTLDDYSFPDPHDVRLFEDIPDKLKQYGDRFRLYCIGFSLYERAWTMRGMESLMMDFIEHPDFVHEFLGTIADYNIAVVEKACTYDIDAVYFGDDWGQQRGLIMGYPAWKEFIYPQLKRMYAAVRSRGKCLVIHSCGDVQELFPDLIEIGLDCFNPFQPEVMDVHALHTEYRGRLSFWGGLSIQKTMPFGTVEEVRNETESLIKMGHKSNYVLSPSHAIEGDVPLDNMLAAIGAVQNQEGAGAH